MDALVINKNAAARNSCNELQFDILPIIRAENLARGNIQSEVQPPLQPETLPDGPHARTGPSDSSRLAAVSGASLRMLLSPPPVFRLRKSLT